MRDPATAAAMSDPDRNRWFRRRWVEPVLPQVVEAAPAPATENLDLLGRELLAAWRRELASREVP